MHVTMQSYAATVASAALRHDFGVPLSRIGRNAAAVRELMEEGVLTLSSIDQKRDLQGHCDNVCALADTIHHTLQDFGVSISRMPADNENPVRNRVAIDAAYARMHAVVGPRVSAVLEHCRGMVRILRADAGVSPSTLRRSSQMVESALRLSLMYEGLRYFFRLEDAPLSFGAIKLRVLIDSVVKAVQMSPLSPPGIVVTSTVFDDVEVDAISAQLVLVFQNILTNAMKFAADASEPNVEITIRQARFIDIQQRYPRQMERYSATGRWAEISISDNGYGMDPAISERIFQLYFTDNSSGINAAGTGMGLAIAKLAVMLHGGAIFVARAADPTTIIVALPMANRDGIALNRLTQSELVRRSP